MTDSAKTILARALRETALTAQARLWFAFRPNVQAVCERLAFYITDKVKHPSAEPLLNVLLKHAFADLARAKAADVTDDAQLQVAFYTGLCRVLPALLEVKVSRRGSVWDPFLGEPLAEWLANHPGAQFADVDPDPVRGILQPSAFRAAMVGFLFSPRDMAEIGKGIKQVLAGD